MKKTRFLTILSLASLLLASNGYGAKISWTLPTAYKDGSPIAPSDARRIVVDVYWGPTKEGPWMPVASSGPGGTTASAPDPPPWETRWYTVKSTLGGVESDFAAPVRRTNYSIPITSLGKRIAKKMLANKGAVILSGMLLLLGLAWFVRHRGRRGRR
jgi:hypothetical protein